MTGERRADQRLRGVLLDGWGRVAGSGVDLDGDGRITRIIPDGGAQSNDEGAEASAWITPGLIDIHCHGGGGASFPDATCVTDVAQAIAEHRRAGTTALVASTVSMEDALPCIRLLAEACEAGELAGIHLEGPYISAQKAGAQNPDAIRLPDLAELAAWLEAGRGHIKTMTMAPEVRDAQAAARLLLDAGARPSWGHTSATGEQTREVLYTTADYATLVGFPAPPQTATHLFNAMPPLGHRTPGPVVELLAAARRGDAMVELVADGVHAAPNLVGEVAAWVPEGIVFVTDAMAGAGVPDGDYELGGLAVTISGGVARMRHNNAIAGGTSRLSDQVKRMVGGGFVPMPDAVRACVANPARAIDLTEDTPGVTLEFRVGDLANLVTWDADLKVQQVIREGALV